MNKRIFSLSVFAVALAMVFGLGAINETKALSDNGNGTQSRGEAYPYGYGYGNLGGES